jgi:hypothetical protein
LAARGEVVTSMRGGNLLTKIRKLLARQVKNAVAMLDNLVWERSSRGAAMRTERSERAG